MDGIANVARQQQQAQQPSSPDVQGRATQMQQSNAESTVEVVKQLDEEAEQNETKINSKEQVQELVDQLNKVMEPVSTNIKFGVDSQDVFYVSVIEAKTNRMIRRFPAEQAADFLPKMQEVTGILFDSKG